MTRCKAKVKQPQRQNGSLDITEAQFASHCIGTALIITFRRRPWGKWRQRFVKVTSKNWNSVSWRVLCFHFANPSALSFTAREGLKLLFDQHFSKVLWRFLSSRCRVCLRALDPFSPALSHLIDFLSCLPSRRSSQPLGMPLWYSKFSSRLERLCLDLSRWIALPMVYNIFSPASTPGSGNLWPVI